MTANTVTLADGREVASDSVAWKDECFARHRHVTTLRSLRHLQDRRAYLRELEKAAGAEFALRVRDDYAKDWEARKAAAAAAEASTATTP